MYIKNLPPKYKYASKSQSGRAYVKDGILYIVGRVAFEGLMYNLAYSIRGNKACYYCGEELSTENRTLDHMYPRKWGGVSIPDNLVPCCRDCNWRKETMTYEQFMQYRGLKTSAKKIAHVKKCEADNIKVLKSAKFVIERDWITVYDIQKILKQLEPTDAEKRSSKQEAAYYKIWKEYTRPVIISANGQVLQGNPILWDAKKNHRRRIVAIVLENVIVLE